MRQQRLFEDKAESVHKIGVNWLHYRLSYDDNPSPYYQLNLADDYYQPGENRKTVNRLRKMIRQYVQEQAEQGRVFVHHDITSSYWTLHKDMIELIALWLDKPLHELYKEAEADRERWVRIRGEARKRQREWEERLSLYFMSQGYEVENALSILGLSHTATEEDIKRQYRKFAMKSHPDTGGSVEAFRRIHKAYEVLQNWNRGIAV